MATHLPRGTYRGTMQRRATATGDFSLITPAPWIPVTLSPHRCQGGHISPLMRLVCVHVPRNALAGDLRVIAEEGKRIRRRVRIKLPGHKHRLLLRRLVLPAHSPIQNGQVVMGSKIVGVNLLQPFKLLYGGSIVVLLIISDSQ